MANPSKPGILLLRAGWAISISCLIVLAALTYGLHKDYETAWWRLLCTPIIVLLLVSPLAFFMASFVCFGYSFLYGIPSSFNTKYAFQWLRYYSRGVFGFLLIVGSVLSMIAVLFPSHAEPKQLPTADEFFGPPPTLAQRDHNRCLSYGFKEGTDAYSNCRMTIDQHRTSETTP